MTDLDDHDLFTPTPANPAAAPRKCRRHQWLPAWDLPAFDAARGRPPHKFCASCGAIRDDEVARRNRRNRQRGNRTSADLAAYLGGRNVEALKLPWDVEVPGARIQSKRLAVEPSRAAVRGFIDAIDASDALRAFYLVRPGQRLASGIVTVFLEEWVAWHGWSLPDATVQITAGTPLLTLGVDVFRDWHVKENAA